MVRSYIESVYRRGAVTDAAGEIHELGESPIRAEHGEAIRDLIVAEHVTSTFETGLAYGLSALHICEGLLANDPPGRHVAIDPMQIEWHDAGLASLEAAGVASMVEFIREPSHLALPRMLIDGRRFDLGFIDGGHSFEYAFIDCFYAVQLLRPGGLLVVDDVWMPAIDLVVRYLVTNLGCTRVGLLPPQTAGWHPRRSRQPGAGAQMAIVRTPEGPTDTELLLHPEWTEEWSARGTARPWYSFEPFTAPVPRWISRLQKLFARYDRDNRLS